MGSNKEGGSSSYLPEHAVTGPKTYVIKKEGVAQEFSVPPVCARAWVQSLEPYTERESKRWG